MKQYALCSSPESDDADWAWPPTQIAEVYIWRGEKDKAFEWLQVSLDNHDTGLLSLMIDPLVLGLRHDARYTDVLMKIGLPARL